MMDAAEREELQRRLSEMKFNKVRREIFRLDPKAEMKYWRNSIWDEYHTLYVLPTEGIVVVLVEKQDREETNDAVAASPKKQIKQERVAFEYVGARVQPIGDHRAKNSRGV